MLVIINMIRSGLFILLGACFFALGTNHVAQSHPSFNFWGVAFALLCLADFAIKSRARLQISLPVFLITLAYCVTLGSSIFSTVNYEGASYTWQYLSVLTLLLVWSQPGFNFGYRQVVNFFKALIFVFSLYLLSHHCFGLKFGWGYLWLGDRLILTFGNANYLASFLVLTLPLLVVEANRYRVSDKASFFMVLLQWFFPVANYLMLLMTGSRNGILVGSFVLILSYLGSERIRSGKWISLKAVTALFLMIMTAGTWMAVSKFQVLDKLTLLFSGGGNSVFGRLSIWQVTLEKVTSSLSSFLFGSGFGALYPLSMGYKSESLRFELDASGFRHCHSEYLEILLEGGVLSLGLILCAIGFFFWTFYRQLSNLKDEEAHYTFLALAVSLSGIALFAMATVALRYMVVLVPLAVCAGLYLAGMAPAFKLGKKLSLVLVGTLVVLNVFSLKDKYNHYRSDLFLYDHILANKKFVAGVDAYLENYTGDSQQMTKPQSLRDQEEVSLEFIRKAIRQSPERIEPYYHLMLASAAAGESFRMQEVQKTYEKIESLIPFFKNNATIYAYFLAKTGDFQGALSVMESFCERRYYNMDYLSELMFYQNLCGEKDGLLETCQEMIYRVGKAELTRPGTHIKAVTKAANYNVIFHVSKGENTQVARPIAINAKKFALGMPPKVLYNRTKCRDFCVAALQRVLSDYVGVSGEPRFTHALRSINQDFVHQLLTGQLR